MKNVIIFGTGKSAETLEKLLNSSINVIAYADNNNIKWGKKHNDKIVLNPLELKNIEFDYILIGSQFNERIYNQLLKYGIHKKKIFQFTKYIINSNDYIDGYKNYIKNNSKEIETLVTGSSYSSFGFNSCIYKKKAINISAPSQDLYYDYNLVKWAIENNELKALKEVIIGLSYYCFEYDMSLSAMKGNVYIYNKNLGLSHNLINIDAVTDGVDETIEIGNEIFNFTKDNKVIFTVNENENQSILSTEIGKAQAELDCRKNYPDTVNENTRILDEYIEFLHKKNIRPILVVFPTNKYYYNNFSYRIEKEFKTIINFLKEKYNVEFIDYFRGVEFDDTDFRDVSHLNSKGSEKFTKILNNLIK